VSSGSGAGYGGPTEATPQEATAQKPRRSVRFDVAPMADSKAMKPVTSWGTAAGTQRSDGTENDSTAVVTPDMNGGDGVLVTSDDRSYSERQLSLRNIPFKPKKSALRRPTVHDLRAVEVARLVRKEVYVYVLIFRNGAGLVVMSCSLMLVCCVCTTHRYLRFLLLVAQGTLAMAIVCLPLFALYVVHI